MSLYRLDFLRPDGTIIGPVKGTDVGILPTGDVLTRHMATARQRAIQAAEKLSTPVLVSRIGKAGQVRGALVLHPDGRASRPPGTRAGRPTDDCKAGTDQPCFCPACRASRRSS